MRRNEVISRLRSAESELRSRGVLHVAVFGSVARGEETSASDIDIVVELVPDARIGAFAYAGIVKHVEALFSGAVDVSNRVALKERIRSDVERDAIYAF